MANKDIQLIQKTTFKKKQQNVIENQSYFNIKQYICMSTIQV